jgi:hypothetical protein
MPGWDRFPIWDTREKNGIGMYHSTMMQNLVHRVNGQRVPKEEKAILLTLNLVTE